MHIITPIPTSSPLSPHFLCFMPNENPFFPSHTCCESFFPEVHINNGWLSRTLTARHLEKSTSWFWPHPLHKCHFGLSGFIVATLWGGVKTEWGKEFRNTVWCVMLGLICCSREQLKHKPIHIEKDGREDNVYIGRRIIFLCSFIWKPVLLSRVRYHLEKVRDIWWGLRRKNYLVRDRKWLIKLGLKQDVSSRLLLCSHI